MNENKIKGITILICKVCGKSAHDGKDYVCKECLKKHEERKQDMVYDNIARVQRY